MKDKTAFYKMRDRFLAKNPNHYSDMSKKANHSNINKPGNFVKGDPRAAEAARKSHEARRRNKEANQ